MMTDMLSVPAPLAQRVDLHLALLSQRDQFFTAGYRRVAPLQPDPQNQGWWRINLTTLAQQYN